MQPKRPHKATNTSANNIFFIIGRVTCAATLADYRLLLSIDKLSRAIDFVNHLPRTDASRDGRLGAIQNGGRIADRSATVPGRPVAAASQQRKGRNESKSSGPADKLRLGLRPRMC